MFAAARDITELKRLDQIVRQDASVAKADFLSSTVEQSHNALSELDAALSELDAALAVHQAS